MVARTAKALRAKKRPPATSSTDASGEQAAQPNSVLNHTIAFIEPERRQALIAESAYYRAQRRDFAPGHELEDWCAAESEIDGMLSQGETPTPCGS
jgi:hypothetical protein